MNAPISTVTRREQDLWVAFRRVVALPDSVVYAEPDDDSVEVSDVAFDDFLSGEPIPE